MALSLRLIEQALVLGETGNFARAAERLGITQPTLTRNIAALEANLGMRLFDRGRGGAAPTVFGLAVIDRGTTLLRDAQALRAELQALAGMDTGQLSIAAGPYVAEDLVGPAVARLINQRPRLRVRVTVVGPELIEQEVLAGRHELGLGSVDSQPAHDALSIVPLRERRLVLACRAGHPLAGIRPSMQQVLQYPLVSVFMHGQTARVAAMGDGRAGTEDPSRKGFAPAVEVNSIDTAKQVARNSDALFPGSLQMLSTELARGDLVCLDYDSPQLRTRAALVRLRDRTPSPVALMFMGLIRKREAELLALETTERPAPVAA